MYEEYLKLSSDILTKRAEDKCVRELRKRKFKASHGGIWQNSEAWFQSTSRVWRLTENINAIIIKYFKILPIRKGGFPRGFLLEGRRN